MHATAQALLYDVSRRVRAGYHWWTVGEVETEKILALIAKFEHRYEVNASSVARHRKKAADDPSVTLFVWPLRNDPTGYTTRFGFLLLATEHLDGEVMYDGRRRPVRVNFYANQKAIFHLMPHEVEVEKKIRKPGPKPKEKPVRPPVVLKVKTTEYDWQLSAKSLELMRERFASEINNPAGLERLRKAYQSLPMTSGYRAQFRTVLTELKPAWKRASTPAVKAAKQAIKEGTRENPFAISTLPYIRGFPKLYDDPPMTLSTYLDANVKARKAVERKALEQIQAEHSTQGV